MFDTIVALASGATKSALAIIRLSGDDCFKIVSSIFTKQFDDSLTKEILFGYIVDENKKVDQVVLLKYKAPHSFTGENSVEIITHGSMLIVREVIDICLKHGARMATNGEFSSRAFLNGKIDLVQAEAINDLINATTKESKSISLYALEGFVSHEFYPIKEQLADLLSNIEVNIDYPEYEDIEQVNREKIVDVCEQIRHKLSIFLKNAKLAIKIKNGVNVAIIGEPNVGKSSLLNALIGEEKAIVTEIEGTTRDIVEGDLIIEGIPFHFFDTAGQRKTDNPIELIGIDKAKEAIKNADLLLYVVEGNKISKKLIETFADKPYIIVHNKKDLYVKEDINEVYTSASKKEIDELINKIKEIFFLNNGLEIVPSFNNARQLGLLSNIDLILKEAIEEAKSDVPIDLVSINLLKAYNDMLDLLGEGNKNDLSEEIFSRFCVGK